MVSTMAMAWAGPQDATSTGTLAGLGLFTAFVLAPYAVGVVLTLRVPHHGAGWAFCGLATALSLERVRGRVRDPGPGHRTRTYRVAS